MDTKKLLLVNKRNFYNHSWSQTQQQTQDIDIQEEQIRIKMNLPYFEGTIEKLWRILRFHRVRPTFSIKKALRKVLFKSKDYGGIEEKTKLLMKLTVVTTKQSTVLNLHGL